MVVVIDLMRQRPEVSAWDLGILVSSAAAQIENMYLGKSQDRSAVDQLSSSLRKYAPKDYSGLKKMEVKIITELGKYYRAAGKDVRSPELLGYQMTSMADEFGDLPQARLPELRDGLAALSQRLTGLPFSHTRRS